MIEPTGATRKARGAFFTPEEIARFLADWAIRAPSDRVLEPSCGEAVFLLAAARRFAALGAKPVPWDRLEGIDIHEESVAFAKRELAGAGVAAQFRVGDFFDFRPEARFDAVIGNPPYVRYQSFTGAARTKALEAALAQGIRLTGLASSWAAFVLHASAFLRPQGRLALVLPAELLSVHYAAPVRRFLMHRFSRVRLVLFEERVFPGVQEEVVLLLAEGAGPTRHCELLQAKNVEDLDRLDESRWTPADAGEKWTAGLLDSEAADIYSGVLGKGSYTTLEEWGDTTLGMVSGNNRYFTLSAARARELGLDEGDLLPISPPGSRHLRDITFTERAWQRLRDADAPVYLFDPPPDAPSRGALRARHEITAAFGHQSIPPRGVALPAA
jgi:adenine-specific DNA methylase